MHRAAVLALLDAHALRSLEAHEAAMVVRTRAFVQSHPDCLWRTCVPGHLTGSAWVIDRGRTRTLLTHHRKLGKWLQLGGHADGDPDLPQVALREAREESGLRGLVLADTALFDVDCHVIPARPGEPEHVHYDLRFIVEADPGEPLVMSAESKALAWIELAAMSDHNPEASMMRMARKTLTGFETRAC